MKKIILLSFVLLSSSYFLYAQNVDAKELEQDVAKAKKLYENDKYNTAISSYIEILSKYNNSISDSLLLEIYSQVAHSFYLTKNFSRAIFYYSHCVEAYQVRLDTIQIIKTYRKIGISYRRLGLNEKAQFFYAKGLDLATRCNSYKNISELYISMSNVFSSQKRYNESRKYCKKSIKIAHQINDSILIAINYMNFGELFYFEEKYDSAISSLTKSLKYQRDGKHKFLDSETYKYFAQIYQEKGNYYLAEEYLQKSIKIEQQSYSAKRLIISLKLLSTIYENQEKYEQANLCFKKYSHLNDSILSEENKKNTSLYESLFLLQNIKNENKIQKEKIERLRIIYVSAAIALLFLLFIIILLVKNRIKIKAFSNEIFKKNEIIISQNKELNLHKESLQELVDEKTEKLKVALHNAQESDRLKSLFLKNISHEIRTPMNAIIGFSSLLSFNEDDSNYEYLKIIDGNLKDFLKLVADIIRMSELQAQITVIAKKSFLVKELLNELYSNVINLRETLNKKHISIHFDQVESLDVELNSDRGKIYSIIFQLLENALKYTEQGSINLHIITEEKSIQFQIVDTGIGIEKGKINTIFEKFVKIEGSEKLYRGAGLGLAIVKDLVTIIKGNISVESEVGGGSSFSLSLPR